MIKWADERDWLPNDTQRQRYEQDVLESKALDDDTPTGATVAYIMMLFYGLLIGVVIGAGLTLFVLILMGRL